MSSKVFLNIHGGLGNQLFQLAAAYSFAEKNGKKLHVLYKPKPDGFGRTLLVDQLLSDSLRREIIFQSKTEIGLAFRAYRKIRRKLFPWTYIEEDQQSCEKDNQLEGLAPRGLVELFGFWQDEEFFMPVVENLRSNIKVDIPLVDPYRKVQQQICNTNSVCIGARLYEDNLHDQTIEAEENFRSLIERADRLKEVIPDAHFFVFSSSDNPMIEEACSQRKHFFLARAKDGITETLQTLSIMSQCKHHIFNQSTFYWWGAWLSESIHGVDKNIIIPPARLFSISRSGIPKRWSESAKAITKSPE